ncbi:uncharacterized protein LOC127739106 [Mytilus californianus]|uniref:uncharacterized protein LOC127739106 n=1 Tax=Mytilus californianus TaxID=6549 RepID=UPI0022475CC5|nr:uncharacterized protein LOC127739106 [Mytilus californianus]
MQRIPNGLKCNINCSRKYGNIFSQWCNICKSWKDELRKLCRYKKQWDKINWKEIDTIDFPHSSTCSYEAISKVFCCLSMRFPEHWKSILDFDFYVQTLNNASFIERRWLKDTVDTHLLEANGILLTANMGYGKSSIISNIYCKKTDTFDFRNVPNSLALLYQLNFKRIFKDSGNLFNDFLPVFEVLCTIQNPIDNAHLIEVSQIDENSKRRQLETLLGNELGHFLKFEDGKISFLHKSISDFLTDERRNKLKFFVHKENGHKLFAEYLLGKFKIISTSKTNLTELIHHVAMSKNFEFETRLFSFVRDLLSRDKMLHLELLYQVVWKYNDYHTTDLLLKYIGVAAINTVNTMNQSPAFIAASQENDMHLNAFHLAVEHGQLDIVKLLLNYNKSFADTHSLYKASEKGHTQILKLLLDTGSKDECLPCNGMFYWLPLLSNRQQQTIKFDKIRSGLTLNQDVHIKTFFYDDWRLIICETALNTAVRNGHLEIVKKLLREKFSAINCTTYDGKTPLMTAVRYNRTDIFYHLYLNGANLTTKCVHSFNIYELRSTLDISEVDLLTTEQCPVGATLAHVIAMHVEVTTKTSIHTFKEMDEV